MKLTKEQIGLDRITPSMLLDYEACPKLFYYKYWLGLKLPQDMRHLLFGTAYHSAIGNIYNQYDDNFKGGWQYADFALVKKAFLDVWKEGCISDDEFSRVLLQKSNKCQTVGELYEQMKADGLQMLESYWENKEWLLTEHGIDIVKMEIPMKIDIVNPANPDEKLPIPLSMRLDALTRLENIAEHKTSADEYDPIETRNSPQGQAYFYGKWRETKKFPTVTYIVNIKGKREKTRPQVIKLEFDESDAQAFYHRVEAILQRIANREFDIGKASGFSRYELEKYEAALSIN